MKREQHAVRRDVTRGGLPDSGPEARRRQILVAAEECFREKGFHGASITDISTLAGVSAGHIYYYFANKEEIIAAIAEAELEALLEIHDSVRNERDVVEAIVRRSGDVALYYANPENARLRLEILAEGARNPRILALVRALDLRARESAYKILRLANGALDGEVLEKTISVQYEMISAIVSGFTARAVRGVEADKQLLRVSVMETVNHVLRTRVAPIEPAGNPCSIP
ncbi:MAG: helix-turn-helix domain-containing protein [Thauera propionica]|nr:helix-turn-helix domain-containing protein [Thauera propionica]